MKALLKSIAGVALVACVGTAQAANYTLDDTSVSGISVFSGTAGDGILNAGDIGLVQGFVGTGGFLNTYGFALPSAVQVAGSANQLKLNFGASQVFNIDGFTMSLYDVTNSTTIPSTPVGDTQVINLPLQPGLYAFSIGGVATGLSGGSYQLQYAVSAVPEPSTIALMVAGLAVVGFSLRSHGRRSDRRVG